MKIYPSDDGRNLVHLYHSHTAAGEVARIESVGRWVDISIAHRNSATKTNEEESLLHLRIAQDIDRAIYQARFITKNRS